LPVCVLRAFVDLVRLGHAADALILVVDAIERPSGARHARWYQSASCAAPPDRPSPVGGEEQDTYCEDIVVFDAIEGVAKVDGGDGV
jgi:hypothetical protein